MSEALEIKRPTVSPKEKWLIIDHRHDDAIDTAFVRSQMLAAKKAYAFLHVKSVTTEIGRMIAAELPSLFIRYRYEATRSDLLRVLNAKSVDKTIDAQRSLAPDVIEATLQSSYDDVLGDPTRCPGFQPVWPPAISALARSANSAAFLIGSNQGGVIVASPSAREDDTGRVFTTNWVWINPKLSKPERQAVQADMVKWLLDQDTDEYRASVNLENFRSAAFHQNCGYKASCFLVAEN